MKPQLTIEAFADWCEKQPPEKEYDYTDPFGCAFCAFLKNIGIDQPSVGPDVWWTINARLQERPLPEGVNAAVHGDGSRSQWNFGALTARLRAPR